MCGFKAKCMGLRPAGGRLSGKGSMHFALNHIKIVKSIVFYRALLVLNQSAWDIESERARLSQSVWYFAAPMLAEGSFKPNPM